MPANVNMSGRRVLLVAPQFFGYEKRISERLESQGAEVHFVDDRPSNGVLSKVLIRLGSIFIQPILAAYHREEIKRLRDIPFDDMLFIEPESCSAETIRGYREAFPGARLILYMWDSFENKAGHLRGSLKYFDKAFSFDRSDCNEYGLSFRPLFFASTPSSSLNEATDTYGFSFIGTIHSDRLRIIKDLAGQAKRDGISIFVYPYLPSKLIFWLYKLTKREFWNTSQRDFFFNSLPYTEVLHTMRDSIAIVDIEHPGQRGLTMRTLEVIGACKKLITTNLEVVHYPFYSPDRVQIIDRKCPRLAPGFLKEPAEPLPPHIYADYSLDGWISDLFEESISRSVNG